MLHRLPIVAACAWLAGSTPACTAPAHGPWELPLDTEDALWVPYGAVVEPDALTPLAIDNGRALFADGSASVVFTIKIDREALSRALVDHFAATAWRERDRDYLNQGIATSFKSGWREVCSCVLMPDKNGTFAAPDPYYDWHGEWENRRDDIVRYNLSTWGPELRGYVSRIPRHLVDAAPR